MAAASEKRQCKSCNETKLLMEFQSRWRARTNGEGDQQFWTHECNTCRAVRRRAEAFQRGLLRDPHAFGPYGEIRCPSKLCKKCGVEKDLTEFVVKHYAVDERGNRYPRRLSTHCLECGRANKARYYLTSESQLRKRLKKYGITPEDYDRMYAAQGGKCALCGTSCKTLAVDHCHASGKVRDLLCRLCNSTLGLVNDNAALLHKMAAYLKRHEP